MIHSFDIGFPPIASTLANLENVIGDVNASREKNPKK